MHDMYDALAATRLGARALSAARLRYQVLKLLYQSLEASGLNQSDLARRLGVRKSAVSQVFRGDGNLRVSTLAEYLHEMNVELAVSATQVGTPRALAIQEMEREWTPFKHPIRGYATKQGVSREVDVEDLDWHESAQHRALVPVVE